MNLRTKVDKAILKDKQIHESTVNYSLKVKDNRIDDDPEEELDLKDMLNENNYNYLGKKKNKFNNKGESSSEKHIYEREDSDIEMVLNEEKSNKKKEKNYLNRLGIPTGEKEKQKSRISSKKVAISSALKKLVFGSDQNQRVLRERKPKDNNLPESKPKSKSKNKKLIDKVEDKPSKMSPKNSLLNLTTTEEIITYHKHEISLKAEMNSPKSIKDKNFISIDKTPDKFNIKVNHLISYSNNFDDDNSDLNEIDLRDISINAYSEFSAFTNMSTTNKNSFTKPLLKGNLNDQKESLIEFLDKLKYYDYKTTQDTFCSFSSAIEKTINKSLSTYKKSKLSGINNTVTKSLSDSLSKSALKQKRLNFTSSTNFNTVNKNESEKVNNLNSSNITHSNIEHSNDNQHKSLNNSINKILVPNLLKRLKIH